MRFEYDYKRDATEWGNAINNGEDVYHNINKVIDVTKHHTQTNVWPSGTKMVLVDANNKDKYYYLYLYTKKARYTIDVREKYMGCDYTNRTMGILEDWNRGNDFPDGHHWLASQRCCRSQEWLPKSAH